MQAPPPLPLSRDRRKARTTSYWRRPERSLAKRWFISRRPALGPEEQFPGVDSTYTKNLQRQLDQEPHGWWRSEERLTRIVIRKGREIISACSNAGNLWTAGRQQLRAARCSALSSPAGPASRATATWWVAIFVVAALAVCPMSRWIMKRAPCRPPRLALPIGAANASTPPVRISKNCSGERSARAARKADIVSPIMR